MMTLTTPKEIDLGRYLAWVTIPSLVGSAFAALLVFGSEGSFQEEEESNLPVLSPLSPQDAIAKHMARTDLSPEQALAFCELWAQAATMNQRTNSNQRKTVDLVHAGSEANEGD
ncbi:MAG: hypothetical protein F6J87_14880 [Spirulina sp. SIO3F2]|nr:hypothetical protein [Spirulina sp. SIO3F2]